MTGAASLAVAAAMVGIVTGGIVGGPIGTRLIERAGLRPAARGSAPSPPADLAAGDLVLSREPADPAPATVAGEDPGAQAILKGVVSLLAAMAVGSWISAGFTALGVTLPAYIGAMLAAAALTEPGRRHLAGSACPTACSTTSATRRSRCSSRWR